MLLSLIGSFQLFELLFILLNGPGPENRGLTVVMYPYQRGFEVGELGYASAIGWTLALVLMGPTVIQRMGREGSPECYHTAVAYAISASRSASLYPPFTG